GHDVEAVAREDRDLLVLVVGVSHAAASLWGVVRVRTSSRPFLRAALLMPSRVMPRRCAACSGCSPVLMSHMNSSRSTGDRPVVRGLSLWSGVALGSSMLSQARGGA